MNEAKHPDQDHAEEWADHYERIGRAAAAAERFHHQLTAAARQLPGKDNQWTEAAYTQVLATTEALERDAARLAASARQAYRTIHASAPRTYQQAMNYRTIPEEERQ